MKKQIKVNIRGRENREVATITRQRWSVKRKGKTKKVFMYVARDKNNVKLSRSTKIKSFTQAKEVFERKGTFNDRESVYYFFKSKEVTKDIRSFKALRSQPKTRSGFYQFTSIAYMPNGKKIVRTSNKHTNDYDIKKAQKEANDRLLSEISLQFGKGYDADNGKTIKNIRQIPISSKITYFTKR